MPDEIKERITKSEFGDHVRQKKNGVFEIRMSYKGKYFYGSSRDLNEARKKFIADIIAKCTAAATPAPEPPKATEPALILENDVTVEEYALNYLEVFKKNYICEKAFRNYSSIVRIHIGRHFHGKKISEVTATACQQLMNDLKAAKKGRTAEDVKNLLNWICGAAVADKLLSANPMAQVIVPKHKRKAGKQIPVEIMSEYLATPPENRIDLCIWLMAYSGVRPCEIKTIVFDGGFMIIKNAKQRPDEEPTERRIPIHPAILPYVKELRKAIEINTDVLAQGFKRRFPKEYRLYDLRHTFTSRIQECEANKSWVDYATAHTDNQNTTTKVYTHWSDTFQVSQMGKLDYQVPKQSQNTPVEE